MSSNVKPEVKQEGEEERGSVYTPSEPDLSDSDSVSSYQPSRSASRSPELMDQQEPDYQA